MNYKTVIQYRFAMTFNFLKRSSRSGNEFPSIQRSIQATGSSIP